MNSDSLALGISFTAIVAGLGILLLAEAVSAGEAAVIGGGAVTLTGVALLTAIVLSAPAAPGSEHEHS